MRGDKLCFGGQEQSACASAHLTKKVIINCIHELYSCYETKERAVLKRALDALMPGAQSPCFRFLLKKRKETPLTGAAVQEFLCIPALQHWSIDAKPPHANSATLADGHKNEIGCMAGMMGKTCIVHRLHHDRVHQDAKGLRASAPPYLRWMDSGT
eukprot:1161345-Pelagomonas_calceolata.AAC.17